MKMNFARIFSPIFLLIVASCLIAQTPQRPDFSGKWVIDVSRSRDLPWLNLKEYSMQVTYDRNAEQLAIRTRLREASFAYSGQAEPKYRATPLLNAKYTIDGAEVTVQDPVATIPVEVKQTATWIGDQLELRNRFEMVRDGRKHVWTTIDVWQLSADGKDLVVQQTIEARGTKQKATLVFSKQ